MESSVSGWSRLQKLLESRLSAEEYSTWIRPLRLRSESAEEVLLQAPSRAFVESFDESYRACLLYTSDAADE